MVQHIQYFKKVPNAPSQAGSRPQQHRVEPPAVGGGEHLVERRTLRFGAADPARVLMNDFKTALLRQPAQIKRMGPGILIEGGNSGIQNCSLHLHRFPWLETVGISIR